jgi:adenylate kinase
MMRIVLLGAPGSGKGTQGERLCQQLKIPRISTGEILRAEVENGTALGNKIEAILQRGALVDDETICRIVRQRIQAPDCGSGFLLDGFPRTVTQAEVLVQANIHVNIVLNLEVPEAVLIERLMGRKRVDDTMETIRARLIIYYQHTAPLIQWYQQQDLVRYMNIMGVGTVDAVHRVIMDALLSM